MQLHSKEANLKMTGEEIREQITKNNHLIEAQLSPQVFMLNKEVNQLLEKNKQLRLICPHKFNEIGYCIYCDTKVN